MGKEILSDYSQSSHNYQQASTNAWWDRNFALLALNKLYCLEKFFYSRVGSEAGGIISKPT